MSGPSWRYNADADPMFSLGAGGLLADIYCPGQALTHPLLSPLFGVWGGLPPLYFLAGSTEMLLDDSVRAHDRALQAGVDARIDVWPDLAHVFPVISWLPEARDAVARIAAFIERHARHASALPLHTHHEALGDIVPTGETVEAEQAGRASL
jgi:monoterpene epsilon-lactone hydrolase